MQLLLNSVKMKMTFMLKDKMYKHPLPQKSACGIFLLTIDCSARAIVIMSLNIEYWLLDLEEKY